MPTSTSDVTVLACFSSHSPLIARRGGDDSQADASCRKHVAGTGSTGATFRLSNPCYLMTSVQVTMSCVPSLCWSRYKGVPDEMSANFTAYLKVPRVVTSPPRYTSTELLAG